MDTYKRTDSANGSPRNAAFKTFLKNLRQTFNDVMQSK